MLGYVRRIGAALAFLLLVSAAAAAQSTTLRILRSAVVVAEPSGDADVLGTVVAGELLELLDERGSWYLVRPPNDGTQRDWRTGWINQAMAELLDAGSVSEPRRVPTETTSSSRRRIPAQTRSFRSQRSMYPGTETTLAWSVLNDFTLGDIPFVSGTSALGFNVATTSNFNSWFGLTTEGGGNYFGLAARGESPG